MSDEGKNNWRFSKEITLGDVAIAVGLMLTLAGLFAEILDTKFTVAEHEKRITAIEATVEHHTSVLGEHDTQIAVMQSKIR